MKMRIRICDLPLRNPFTISRGSFSVQQSVVVELEQDGLIGLGETTKHAYYKRTVESICNSLSLLQGQLPDRLDDTPEVLWDWATQIIGSDSFALSAFDQAVHDLHGKLHATTVYQRAGLEWTGAPLTSITISIDTITRMIQQINLYPDWPIYKIKLGTPADLQIVQALRDETDATLRVDANCAWSVEETIRLSAVFAQLGVEFIEQPLPADASADDHCRVYQYAAIPVIADESCVSERDVMTCADCFHGINIKLSKCGGLTPAIRMIENAKRLGLKIMAGCMIESDVAIGAAIQLAPALDYADLDGAELLSSQPFTGVCIDHGVISRPVGHGIGVRPIPQTILH